VPLHLLPIAHRQQQADGDCLAACAAMVLAYWQRDISYSALLRLLRIQPYGAPAGNIRLLSALGVRVTYSTTNLGGLKALLDRGLPLVVFVRTGELPYWSYQTDHAVVVVGYDEGHVYVNDPDKSDAPIAVPAGDFELAWLERDYAYALVAPSEDLK
jgi:ABC-type bacteriocin/lantibiotic exporter with double-glycine peptidase domain